MDDLRKRRLISGLMLIAVGGVMYFVLRAQDHVSYSALLVLLGSAFIGAYLYFRNYGYLVPGCILFGLGVGNMWAESEFAFGRPALIGLGAGFVGIYVIALAYERKSPWWPLIPGSFMLLIGMGFNRGIEFLFENWPLILVLVGLILVVGALLRPRRAA